MREHHLGGGRSKSRLCEKLMVIMLLMVVRVEVAGLDGSIRLDGDAFPFILALIFISFDAVQDFAIQIYCYRNPPRPRGESTSQLAWQLNDGHGVVSLE